MSMSGKCCPQAPTCCDMRGMLSFHILWIISKGPMSGQEISEELRKRRGTKPTAGTIYPPLKDLREKKLVNMEKKGRETIYTLTEDGRKELDTACTYFCSVFGEIYESCTYEKK